MNPAQPNHDMFDGPPRVVVIGDLNAAADGLRALLRGTGLMDEEERWSGGTSHLVQMGDIFNRGGGARKSLELLLKLRKEAPSHGGQVTILLGNHEAMMTLQDEGYCVVSEYLSFASLRQRQSWPRRVARAARKLRRDRSPGEPIRPLAPRLQQWQTDHVPGKQAMRSALSARGRLGRELRLLPLAVKLGRTVFVHGGLSLDWAKGGVEALNEAGARAWLGRPEHVDQLTADNVLRHPEGPLWNRGLANGSGRSGAAELRRVLKALGAGRLVVGHSRVEGLPEGQEGHVLSRFGGRLLCVDVGITESRPDTWAALVLDRRGVRQWRMEGASSVVLAPSVSGRVDTPHARGRKPSGGAC